MGINPGLNDERLVRPNLLAAITDDAVMIWRAWLPRRHWVMALRLAIANALVFIYKFRRRLFLQHCQHKRFHFLEAATVTFLYAASISSTLATNTIATLLIAFNSIFTQNLHVSRPWMKFVDVPNTSYLGRIWSDPSHFSVTGLLRASQELI